MDFTGVRSAAAAKSNQLEKMGVAPMAAAVTHEDEDESWEHQQIRKAVKSSLVLQLPVPAAKQASEAPRDPQIKKPTAYNLQGIKGRIKDRYET